ncbi:MAG: BtrH N-terminal domain-containing protein, partial [Anaerolineae bacterium]
MPLEPLPGFVSLETHHCVTGSMRHVYIYNGHDVSEEMLLGVGGGVGFIYWHTKGADPFIGGRAKGRPHTGFETAAGRRTGVAIAEHVTTSARKARRTLLELLDAEQPVMLQVDMGFLPYFDFGGQEYHFGAHAVVACGYDPATARVLIADRDAELHPLSMDELERARGSEHRPYPPKHRWTTFDFSQKRQPTPEEIRAAIAEQVEGMLDPPISNLGVKGIRKATRRILEWPNEMDEQALRRTMFNTYIFIDAEGGTGGGIFRLMFSRFLRESAAVTGDERLIEIAHAFQAIGRRWQEVAEIFRQGWATEDPAALLPETTTPVRAIADLEEEAW